MLSFKEFFKTILYLLLFMVILIISWMMMSFLVYLREKFLFFFIFLVVTVILEYLTGVFLGWYLDRIFREREKIQGQIEKLDQDYKDQVSQAQEEYHHSRQQMWLNTFNELNIDYEGVKKIWNSIQEQANCLEQRLLYALPVSDLLPLEEIQREMEEVEAIISSERAFDN